MRRLVAVLAALGVSAALASVVVPSAGASVTGPQVGAVADITWGTSPADIDRTVTSMTDAGVGWVRANVGWNAGEPDSKGALNQSWLTQVDYAVTRARTAGIQVLMPIADGVPYWASADPAKYTDSLGTHWNKYWRPSKSADYADFVGAMVRRYQPMGVHTYEVWNEPNTARFWPSGPNPTEYTQLLAATYPVIKAADPAATVVLGGLSKSDYDFLGQAYAAGAGRYFDAVAVHPYTGTVDPSQCWNQAGTTKMAKDAFCGIDEVHNTMVANGDSSKRIWLTEFGWSTTTGAYGVSETNQALYLTAALDKIRTSYPYVHSAFWYNLRNNYWQGNDPTDFEANMGLQRVDFTAKPAYTALRAFLGRPTTVPTSPVYVPLSPARLADSRLGGTTVDGISASTGAVGPGETRTVQVTGRGGIPASGVGAVVLNVTATGATTGGYLTVFPTGETRPLTSNLNFGPGQTIPNLVITKVGTGGTISIYNSTGSTNLIADVTGWAPAGGGYTALSPARLADSRLGGTTVDGISASTGAVGPGETRTVQVTGRGGIPASGVGAVVLNVTATGATTSGYLTVFPTGETRPQTSNLNFASGQTIPNLVITKVGTGGKISIYNSTGSTNLIADVTGWAPAVS